MNDYWELCKHNWKLRKRELLENEIHKGREFVLKKVDKRKQQRDIE